MIQKTQTNRLSINQSFSKVVFITRLSPHRHLGVNAEIIYAYYFLLSVALVYLEKSVILGGKMDFADIL